MTTTALAMGGDHHHALTCVGGKGSGGDAVNAVARAALTSVAADPTDATAGCRTDTQEERHPVKVTQHEQEFWFWFC